MYHEPLLRHPSPQLGQAAVLNASAINSHIVLIFHGLNFERKSTRRGSCCSWLIEIHFGGRECGVEFA